MRPAGVVAAILLLAVVSSTSCRPDASAGPGPPRDGGAASASAAAPGLAGSAARVGEEAVPLVALAENHSDALVQWVLRGVRDRIVVHVDGHIDCDWIPPATVAAIRTAADEASLRALEVHPYDLSRRANDGFAIWNFIYAAARTGRVREEVWVVPDGTLPDRAAFERLRSAYSEALSGISLEEFRSLAFSGGAVTGSLAGVPVRIVELNNLPSFPEPVLLDIDLDYFTTRSPVDQKVLLAPRPSLDEFFSVLQARGLSTDLATVSYSTIGGYLPYEARYLGEQVVLALRDPAAFRSPARIDARARRAEAMDQLAAGRAEKALEKFLALELDHPRDGPLEAAMADSCRLLGRESEARSREARARQADPLAARLDLFRGDVERQNDRHEQALVLFRKFLEENPDDDAAPYAQRRVAFCQLALQRPSEAAEGFRKLLANRPEHADSRFNLAAALAASGDLAGAIAAQQEACALRPFDPRYSWKLGSYLLAARDAAGAEPHLRRAVEGKPSSATARSSLAICLAWEGRPAEALEQAKAASELDPTSTGFQALVARLREMRTAAPGR